MIHDISELKHVRKSLGITQSSLAKLSGVSQSLIAKIEAGTIDPTYSRAKKLMETVQSLSGEKMMLARDVMNRKIIFSSPRETISDVIKLMKRHGISQLPVIDQNAAVGVVSEALLLDAAMSGKIDTLVQDIMDDSPPVVPMNAAAALVTDLLKHFSIVLVADKGKPVGVITKADIIQKAFERR